MKIPLFASVAALAAARVIAFAPGTNNAKSATLLEAASDSMFDTFVDEAELLQSSDFPISPEKLMERAKEILSPSVGIGTKDGGECLADDFEFCAAVVGPIGKEEYLNALDNFSLEDAFDITPNFFGMSVDPMQPNRVWFFNRVKGIHKGTFMGAEPTGKEIVYPPQIQHMDFNEDGKLVEYGFYTCDRRQGNTGGLGGAFGFMYGVGKPLPIPECQPYKRSFRFRMLGFIGSLAQKLQRKKKD
uniref:Plastid lipid-associated protein/fibrillin conserved domain-containing protein n=1 Tax=Pseudictyota dubia TaxID=2749911 RepID=A0A7R9VTC1_9STRA|mmetsp:Transcript_22420/g.41796  ORF Transcript_22420/g.41796 Transcript_22420/m.41796 type:complete len:244 (+) Transcript_22420:115-846(+)|eukprot:CAMPEP_0197444790 /NCGR_PEP_ID=MMETSP1175-20131217/10178_1 /TAXON_ID=1003142 /ORGANISM="Triceratium dubium, Strain CCMP147" /LENGTH=243 /DNA_ID=CAMNT_0042975643 /DNA_START=115 /DNA_END=846 /DNA_ORIENTATION=-